MGKTFAKVNVYIAGDFGSKGDKVKQWVEANGGTFSRELNHHVTHLISTQNAFKKPIPISTAPLSTLEPADSRPVD
jgi:anthranilate synthase/indole-3-glycerol phosphate synthase/phosphoribosylanthranilate isomerase